MQEPADRTAERNGAARRRPADGFAAGFYRPAPPPGKHRFGVLAPSLAALVSLAMAGEAGAEEPRPRAAGCHKAGAPGGPVLRVAVAGARSGAGNVTVTLYGARREDFLARGGRLARQRIPLEGAASAEACFVLSGPGDYALAVYHDENDDRNFDRNALGLPAEGYGFSNDAPTTLGLPDFDKVRFAVPSGGESRVTVRLRY